MFESHSVISLSIMALTTTGFKVAAMMTLSPACCLLLLLLLAVNLKGEVYHFDYIDHHYIGILS